MLRSIVVLGIVALSTMTAAEVDEWHSKMYREEHTELNARLNDIENELQQLGKKDPQQQEKVMRDLAKKINDNWEEHSKWEEKMLYPAIDNYTQCRDYPFTTTHRLEHTIIRRWISELQQLSNQGRAEVQKFVLKGIELIGLLHAHRETEEKVLLPIFNKHFPPKETPSEKIISN